MKLSKKINKKLHISILVIILFALIITKFITNSFSLQTPLDKIEIYSNNLNYNNNEPGSYKITKSARWYDKDKARITFNVDSVSMTEGKEYKDIILVLNINESLNTGAFDALKEGSIDLVNNILENRDNNIAIVSNSKILSKFTNDKELLINEINDLEQNVYNNHYRSYRNIETILENYTKQDNRDTLVLFVTNGYATKDTPGELGEYIYLKQTYDYLIFNGIQYYMGDTVLDKMKQISDIQYISTDKDISDILFESTTLPVFYDNFNITDYVDTTYYDIDNTKVSVGEVSTENNKITWNIKKELKTGKEASLTIDISLKDIYRNIGGVYPTNTNTEVTSSIKNIQENLSTNETPRLADKYVITYDGNTPGECEPTNIPGRESTFVYTTVKISETVPKCEGYEFKGWQVSNIVEKINDDYFLMPEKDVIIRAEWAKLTLVKKMDGEVVSKSNDYLMVQNNETSKVFGKPLERNKFETITFVMTIYQMMQ